MNKTAIKNFAVWARNKLRSEIAYKARLVGITEKCIAEPLPQSTGDLQMFDIGTSQPVKIEGKIVIEQRNSLAKAIREKRLPYAEAFDAVIEEVAYTWLNRLIAMRFMEVNDYLPSGLRVLSSVDPDKDEPDFVTSPFETDLEFTSKEMDYIDECKDKSRLDELFQFLFIRQCNTLHEILPELFETTNDYTELLLNVSFTDKDGVVWHLVHDIPEDDFNIEKQGQVEIIGWLYQYYNTEPKAKVFSRPSGHKIRKEDVPAATQLFTPDWIVRYMVENSLGRTWTDIKPDSDLKNEWKYYLPEAEQSEEVQSKLLEMRQAKSQTSPEEITFLDPCMGSGHILVYAFDVLMAIYTSQGYTERDATQRIVEKNLYGLEIDDRAAQLAYFAVMMKARFYDRRFFKRKVSPNVCAIQESNHIKPEFLSLFGDLQATAQKLCNEFKDAKEYGSILNLKITAEEISGLEEKFAEIKNTNYDNTFDIAKQTEICTYFPSLIRQAKIMVKRYDVVCTNPPYMGGSGFSGELSEFIKKNYPDSKADLFSAFIEKGNNWTVQNGYNCMVTMQSWMFLSSFEKMREKILLTQTITNLMHMENMVMGIAFGTAVTVFYNNHIKDYKGTYNQIKLRDIENGQPKAFPVMSNRFAQVSTDNFSKIPGSPVAYWVSENFIRAFENKKIKDYGDTKQGIIPGNVNVFLRLWFETNINKIGFNHKSYDDINKFRYKWFPYNKGGSFRRWYGNIEHLINMENNGYAIKYSGANNNYRLREPELYFKKAVTWSKVSSGAFSARLMPKGNLFDIAGCCVFNLDNNLLFCLGMLNTKVATKALNMISPTLNYEVEHIKNIPLIFPSDQSTMTTINELVQQNIQISKTDWDSYETSWDFERHPLIRCMSFSREEVLRDKEHFINDLNYIEGAFVNWSNECYLRFEKLKQNEEELNRIFIDIYGLNDELTPEVADKDVTVRKANLQREIKSLISYAVGCMFGRYSLDVDGLAYAGGEWDSTKYKTFIPDDDNCIPITDTRYFEDDIVGRFVEFVKAVYGEDTLEENLDFIAQALGNKGNSSREIIRNYFLNDFFKDHCKIYQKRPIYWLFDSGKQNGFKALIYIHRYNADTIGNLRVEYLHKVQRIYESEINREQDTIEHTTNAREKKLSENRMEKLQKQLKETKEYDTKIGHLALSRIEIDLDDGVKANYDKVQTGRNGKKLDVLAKI